MTELVTLRFAERQYYDINIDAEVLELQGITNSGTFWTTVEVGTTSKLRQQRDGFRTYVLSALAEGLQPCEVTIG